jgi:hypothetical protein
MKDLIYELVIEDSADEIYAISLVSEPAIEMDFVYFDKEEVKFSTVNEEQRIVMGPILVPDKKILRVDGEGKPYYVFIKAATIQKLAQKYLQNKYQSEVTIEHNGKRVSDVTLIESWITESRTKDKSAVYGLSVPVGTWMGSMKIESDKIWNEFVKTGIVNGFSIEGLFSHQLVEASNKSYMLKELDELNDVEAELVLSKIKAMFESYSDYDEGIRNNAKKGIELNEKVGNKCATQTGKVRAQQIANGEKLSVDTIKRMYSYLSRAETYYDETDTEACGTISYLLWGGKAALSWSRNKLRELGLLEEDEAQPSVSSTYPGEAATGSIAPALLAEAPNLDVYGYETKYFQICPGAQKTFTEIVSLPNDEEYIGMVRSAAVVADAIFRIENSVLEAKKATQQQLNEVIILVKDYKDIIREIDEEHGVTTDVSYMDGHIKTIESFL